MGSSKRKRWCYRTLTTCTIKGYHILIILTLSLLTAYWIFQPSAADLSDLLTSNEQYKAKLNESQQALDTSKQQQSNLEYKEKALASSLDKKTKKLNNLLATNLRLKSYIKRLTQARNQLENQSDTQKDRIIQLQQAAQQQQNISDIIKPSTDNDYWYIKNYNNWIQGIGNDIMLNNESNSNCQFHSDSFMLHKPPLINTDTLFEGATYCQKYRFSHTFDRIITVHCQYIPTQHPDKAGIKYFESDSILNGRPPKPNDPKWVALSFENGKRNHFAIDLKDTTQTTWVYCNNAYDFHISLRPLKKSDPEIYENKKQIIEENFGRDIMPPNVILFVMSATSRNNFMTAAVGSRNYLHSLQKNYNGKCSSDIVQFFRYSTVGSATKNNLNALIAGQCSYCNIIDDNNCDGLATYYDRLGYYVWGLNEYRHKKRLKDNDLCDFFLADTVIPRGCKFGHGIQVETGAEFVKQAMHAQKGYDRGVPHLMIINVQSNRVNNGIMMYSLDRFVKSMLENVNKDNTLINIISDHGPVVLDDDLYSQLEYKNPVNIMLVPKWLRNDTNLGNLRVNQQRFVQHYDMHLFYKELLWKLYEKKPNKMRGDKLSQKMIFENLPKINQVPLSKSIMDEIIASDRNCRGIDDGYCLCDTMQLTNISDISIENNINYVEIIVEHINKLTGNGEWDCHSLDFKQFKMRAYVENKQKTLLKIAISKIIEDKIEEEKLWKDKHLLAFYSTFVKNNENSKYELQSVIRMNDIKSEKCLTTDYDKEQFSDGINFDFGDDEQLNPMFINKESAIQMLKMQMNSKDKIDLKFCDCKEINLKDITLINSLSSRIKAETILVDNVNDKKNASLAVVDVNENKASNGMNRRGKRKRVGESVENVNDMREELVNKKDNSDMNGFNKTESVGNGNNIEKNEWNKGERIRKHVRSMEGNSSEEFVHKKHKSNENNEEQNEYEGVENNIYNMSNERNATDSNKNDEEIMTRKESKEDSDEGNENEKVSDKNKSDIIDSEKKRSNEIEGNIIFNKIEKENVNERNVNEREQSDAKESESEERIDVNGNESDENEAKENESEENETESMKKAKIKARKQKRAEKRKIRKERRSNVLDTLVDKVNDGKGVDNE